MESSPNPRDETVAAIFPQRFYKKFDYNDDGTVKGESEWCEWMKKGTGIPRTVPDKVERLKKDPAIWAALKPYYDQWKAGEEMIADGTPLDTWPHLQAHEIELIKSFKIYTLEDFATLSDGDLERLGFPNARIKRDRAADFLSKSQTMDEVHALRAEIERLKQAQTKATSEDDEVADLKAELRARGVEVDGRWKKDRLKEEIAKAKERSAV